MGISFCLRYLDSRKEKKIYIWSECNSTKNPHIIISYKKMSCPTKTIWSFDEFRSYYLRFLNIKPISYLTMVCYHRNPIRRTLGLTISPFLMLTNLGYLGEKERNLPLKPIMDQSNDKQCKTRRIN